MSYSAPLLNDDEFEKHLEKASESNRIIHKKDRINILHVDDDDISLLIFRTIFEDKYNVFTSSSPQRGREILKRESIDIIVCDHYMPKETGKDFFKSIEPKYKSKIKILLTSHASDMGYVSRALKSGEIWAHIVKPVDEQNLIETIEKASKIIENQKNNAIA